MDLPAAMPKPDYGLDAPKLVRRFAVRGGFLVAFSIVLYFANRNTSPGTAQGLASILAAIGLGFLSTAAIMLWSSRVAKLKLRDRILAGFSWRGDETVLDVGCGRGLLLIGAAKRLRTGKATGVDTWQSEHLSGNNPEAVLRNAKMESVENRVKIESADARKLPFGASSFDVVVSSLAIHNIQPGTERAKALREIARVLKPGGRVTIFDIFHTSEYAKVLLQLGLTDIQLSGLSLLWGVPCRTVTARKA
ncbi:MAG TPA: class I SAM-dependent methyltransferase [Bryobacteraceae bacterium]|jgi:arsenite methyltransferase|nr:class I SAM-dependent methyltransferase [Bryobacteraceae bacterium]